MTMQEGVVHSASVPSGKFFTPTAHHDTYPAVDPTQWDLTGKFVLVTGASRGIGAATAIAFARAGASGIAIGARSGGALEDVEGAVRTAAAERKGASAPQVLRLALDVTDEASVRAAARVVEDAFGRLDVLINNAGHMEEARPAAEVDARQWWKTWDVNVRGTFLVTQACLPLMLAGGGGERIVVNVSSRGAHLLFPGYSGYQVRAPLCTPTEVAADCDSSPPRRASSRCCGSRSSSTSSTARRGPGLGSSPSQCTPGPCPPSWRSRCRRTDTPRSSTRPRSRRTRSSGCARSGGRGWRGGM